MPKYKVRDKYNKLYKTLISLEESQQDTSISEIARKSGYKPGSMAAYARNKLRNIYLFETKLNTYRVRGIRNVNFESFVVCPIVRYIKLRNK